MNDLVALVPGPDGRWQRYRNPQQLICAWSPEQVLPCLEQVDALVASGLTAVGMVAYDAAPAFDPALSCQPGTGPLLLFGLYAKGEDCTLPTPAAELPRLGPELGWPDYARAVERIHQYLRAGETYQVNFTQRLRGHSRSDPESLFAALYAAQPTATALYLRWGQQAICSVSPELFFRLDRDRITMEPMKGTRPRAQDAARDQQLRQELLDSEKERAENLMIVDMIRNDLGRIARPGSVHVDQLFKIIGMPTVWQQISTISANTDADLCTLFRALFPCASVTGAPKRQTMGIIEELERSPRGIYTGALGILEPGRRGWFNVAIRSLVLDLDLGQAEYGIGSGVVWDSEASEEWQETRIKADVLNRRRQPFALLETMRYSRSTGIDLLPLHLQRLQRSAAYFNYPIDLPQLQDRLQEFVADGDCRLRLLLQSDGEIELQQHPLTVNKAAVRLQLAKTAVDCRDPFLRHKTTARQVYEQARQKLDPARADDVLLWNQRGELTETCIYNLFLEIEGSLLTPSLDCGLLPGTFRQSLLDRGKAREQVLTKADLARASRVLVANSVRGLCEAVLVDG